MDLLKSIGHSLVYGDTDGSDNRTLHIEGRDVRVVRQIGEGGFSFVYEARDHNNVAYALKKTLAQDADARRLAAQEIDAMRAVASTSAGARHCVRFYGAASKRSPDGRCTEYWILMEFCDRSLLDVVQASLKRGVVWKEERVLRVFRSVVAGVAALHSLKPLPLVHRDVKIENVLLDAKGAPKLCDFGSCMRTTREGVVLHTRKEINEQEDQVNKFTTPMYRAPELVNLYSKKPIGTPVDVWALGCVLFVLCFHVHPFEEGGAAQIMGANVRWPTAPKFGKHVIRTIRRCLSVDPRKRPTAAELLQHLDSLLSGGGGTLRRRRQHAAHNANNATSSSANRSTSCLNDLTAPSVSRSVSTGASVDGDDWASFDTLAVSETTARPQQPLSASPDPSSQNGHLRSHSANELQKSTPPPPEMLRKLDEMSLSRPSSTRRRRRSIQGSATPSNRSVATPTPAQTQSDGWADFGFDTETSDQHLQHHARARSQPSTPAAHSPLPLHAATGPRVNVDDWASFD
ncbi:MAG: hypothetical protein MHM6MM_002047 [Cercozoa sp. M6MM]